MFTQQEYMMAWAAYLFGAGLFIACWWFISNKLKNREVRYLSRTVLSVFLLVPWYTGEDGQYLSPAWVISGLEGAFNGVDAFWRAGTPLLTALLVSVVLSCIVSFVLWFKGRKAAEA